MNTLPKFCQAFAVAAIAMFTKMTVALLLSLMLSTGVAFAQTFDDVADGNYDVPATWDQNSGFPGSGDTAIIDSHRVFANITIPAGVDVQVTSGGFLRLPDSVSQTTAITLGGGTLQPRDTATISSDINVLSDSVIDSREGNELSSTISGSFSGSGQLRPDAFREGWTFRVGGASANNAGYSGTWNWDDFDFVGGVEDDTAVGLQHNGGGMGSGTIILNNATFSENSVVGGNLSNDFLVGPEGGTLRALRRDDNTATSPSFSGAISLQGDLGINAGDDGRVTTFSVDSEISGPHKVTFIGGSSSSVRSWRGGARLLLTNPANEFSELEIDLTQVSSFGSSNNQVIVTDVGALGGGPVTVKNESVSGNAAIASAHNSRFVLRDAGGSATWVYENSLTLEESDFHRGIVEFDGLDLLILDALTIAGIQISDGLYMIGTDTPDGILLADWFDVDDPTDQLQVGGLSTAVPEPSTGLLFLLVLCIGAATLRLWKTDRRPLED